MPQICIFGADLCWPSQNLRRATAIQVQAAKVSRLLIDWYEAV